jgi:NarL family two-component system response regulator LiaR
MSRAIRAIVVDDHQILREGVRMLLGQGNETPAIEVVGEAADGAEALALLESTKPDVVVLDLALPGILGIEVCRRAHASGVRVVILTMHVSGEHVRRAREAGADGYVVKGSGVSELAQAIRIVVAGGEGPFPALPPDPISKLTSREREVFVEVAQGHSNREIAVHLGISVHTVNTHRIHVMEKLEVHDAVALTRLAVGAGLLP